MRSIIVALAMLCACAPVAAAHGFREARVRAAARAGGLSELADRAAAAARPTITIDRTITTHAPPALGTSRFGGRPDLPPGTAWPRCKGKVEGFLAQIRVRDLPAAAAPLRRLGGTLLFFTAVEDAKLEFGQCVRVIHAPAGAPLARTAPPKRVLKVQTADMRFKTGIDLPDVSEDYETLGGPLFGVPVPDKTLDRWWALRRRLQGRPHQEHKTLGYLEVPNGGNHCSERGERARATWVNLFVMGPDLWDVGDAGRLQFLISPGSLRAGRFGRVCGVFDSA